MFTVHYHLEFLHKHAYYLYFILCYIHDRYRHILHRFIDRYKKTTTGRQIDIHYFPLKLFAYAFKISKILELFANAH